MGTLISIPKESLITNTMDGYNQFNNAYGHFGINYGTIRLSTVISDTNDILMGLISNVDVYHTLFPASVGSYLKFGGFAVSKNAVAYNLAAYALRNGNPEVATISWVYCGLDNITATAIDGKLYNMLPLWMRTDLNESITSDMTGIYAGLTPITSTADLVETLNAYDVRPVSSEFEITYRLTNCSAPTAPQSARVGDTVTVPLQFTSGYGIVNPSSDIYVTNNGVIIPSQYSNGVLTFTMPDPS